MGTVGRAAAASLYIPVENKAERSNFEGLPVAIVVRRMKDPGT